MVDNMFVFESQTFNPLDLSATDTYSLDVDPDQNFFHLLMSQRFVVYNESQFNTLFASMPPNIFSTWI